ncbi:hypothetical protein E4U52_006280, partial [Claviceps spartinae]
MLATGVQRLLSVQLLAVMAAAPPEELPAVCRARLIDRSSAKPYLQARDVILAQWTVWRLHGCGMLWIWSLTV